MQIPSSSSLSLAHNAVPLCSDQSHHGLGTGEQRPASPHHRSRE
jgi:hypothetical protein